MNNFCNGRLATSRHLILGSFADLAALYLNRFPKTVIENAVSAYETRAAGVEQFKAGNCLVRVIRSVRTRIYHSREGITAKARFSLDYVQHGATTDAAEIKVFGRDSVLAGGVYMFTLDSSKDSGAPNWAKRRA